MYIRPSHTAVAIDTWADTRNQFSVWLCKLNEWKGNALTAWQMMGYLIRLMPPANTAKVRAVWKQKLRSMCHPFRLMRIALPKTIKNQIRRRQSSHCFVMHTDVKSQRNWGFWDRCPPFQAQLMPHLHKDYSGCPLGLLFWCKMRFENNRQGHRKIHIEFKNVLNKPACFL